MHSTQPPLQKLIDPPFSSQPHLFQHQPLTPTQTQFHHPQKANQTTWPTALNPLNPKNPKNPHLSVHPAGSRSPPSMCRHARWLSFTPSLDPQINANFSLEILRLPLPFLDLRLPDSTIYRRRLSALGLRCTVWYISFLSPAPHPLAPGAYNVANELDRSYRWNYESEFGV